MRFYARRVGFYALTLWIAVSLNFLLPRLLPGDPYTILLARLQRSGDVSPAVQNSLRLLLGATEDQSLWQQYVSYWGNLLRGDLGVSVTQFPTPVTDLIAGALPWTIGLVGTATILSFVLGVGLGAWAGWRRGSWVDGVIPSTTLLQSLPYFWVALLFIYVFSVELRWFPIIGAYDVFTFNGPELSWAFVGSVLYHAVLPAVTIIISSVGAWMLGMRNMMVSTLSEDYVMTAQAKGLHTRRIALTYAVRNAAIPSVNGFGVALAFVVAGSLVTEQVFSYPGLGKLMIEAVRNNDYALMQGVFLMITLAVLAALLVMDLVHGLIDPRARHRD
ncbi:ABC transporter permease [Isoptericola halotolerans]|uniref:Peptide/nickel transport system permease protein n=1 Tax=Isoptericola halotolerans TaxID=300560 RepID=A0ABX2A299_9MICO|nr:ABC transporter permease [Isoptericola halotolerans]NOV95882.1 peptide/nickel transport system permease protein [Isoptericola halotolerans]